MPVKLDKPSTLWIWISVGAATLVSVASIVLAVLTSVHGWRVPLMNSFLAFSTILWLGAFTYTAVWWVRRFIARAVKLMRRQITDDVITVMQLKDIERWRQVADAVEPHLRVVPNVRN